MATLKCRVFATSSIDSTKFLPHFYIDVEAKTCQEAFDISRSIDYANYHEDFNCPENQLSSVAMTMLDTNAPVDIPYSPSI